MLDQPPAGFHQPLLQAGKRPLPDPRGQRQPAPQVPEVISNQAQPQPDLVGAKAVAAKPRQRDRLLALLDPLFGRAALVVEAHYRPVVERQVGHDKADAGEQLPAMELDLRHHPPRLLPPGGLAGWYDPRRAAAGRRRARALLQLSLEDDEVERLMGKGFQLLGPLSTLQEEHLRSRMLARIPV
jgi:hypothetical protein